MWVCLQIVNIFSLYFIYLTIHFCDDYFSWSETGIIFLTLFNIHFWLVLQQLTWSYMMNFDCNFKRKNIYFIHYLVIFTHHINTNKKSNMIILLEGFNIKYQVWNAIQDKIFDLTNKLNMKNNKNCKSNTKK